MRRAWWSRPEAFNWVFDNMGGAPLQEAVPGQWEGAVAVVDGDGKVRITGDLPGGGQVFLIRGVWRTNAIFAWGGFWADPEAGDLTNYYTGGSFLNDGNTTVITLGTALDPDDEVQIYYTYLTGETSDKYQGLNNHPTIRRAYRGYSDFSFDYAVDRIFDLMTVLHQAGEVRGKDYQPFIDFLWKNYIPYGFSTEPPLVQDTFERQFWDRGSHLLYCDSDYGIGPAAFNKFTIEPLAWGAKSSRVLKVEIPSAIEENVYGKSYWFGYGFNWDLSLLPAVSEITFKFKGNKVETNVSRPVKYGGGSALLVIDGKYTAEYFTTFVIYITLGGAIGTAQFKYSIDGGLTWEAEGILTGDKDLPTDIGYGLKVYWIGDGAPHFEATDYWTFNGSPFGYHPRRLQVLLNDSAPGDADEWDDNRMFYAAVPDRYEDLEEFTIPLNNFKRIDNLVWDGDRRHGQIGSWHSASQPDDSKFFHSDDEVDFKDGDDRYFTARRVEIFGSQYMTGWGIWAAVPTAEVSSAGQTHVNFLVKIEGATGTVTLRVKVKDNKDSYYYKDVTSVPLGEWVRINEALAGFALESGSGALEHPIHVIDCGMASSPLKSCVFWWTDIKFGDAIRFAGPRLRLIEFKFTDWLPVLSEPAVFWIDEFGLDMMAYDDYPWCPRLAISLTPFGLNPWRGPTLVHYSFPLAPHLVGAEDDTWVAPRWKENPDGSYSPDPEIVGAEMVSDPGFDNAAHWTIGTDWSVASSRAEKVAGAASSLFNTGGTPPVPNRIYKVTCDLWDRGASFVIGLGKNYTANLSGDGAFVGSIYTLDTDWAMLWGMSTAFGKADNFHAKEVEFEQCFALKKFLQQEPAKADIKLLSGLTSHVGGVVARYTDANNYLLATVIPRILYLIKVKAGTPTSLIAVVTTGDLAYADWKTLEIRWADADTAQLFYGGVQVDTNRNVADLPKGLWAGMFATDKSVQIKNFNGVSQGMGLSHTFLRLVRDAHDAFHAAYAGVKGPVIPNHGRNDIENIHLVGEENFGKFTWWPKYRHFGKLSGAWHFNEALTDASGHGHTLTWSAGSPSYAPGICQPGNTAVIFDETANAAMASNALFVPGLTPFSITLIIKGVPLIAGWRWLANKVDADGWVVQTKNAADDDLQLKVTTSAGDFYSDIADVLDGNWHMITWMVDFTEGKIFKIKDGVLLGEDAMTKGDGILNTAALTIGYQGFFELDYFRYERRILPAEEYGDTWDIVQGLENGSDYPESGHGLGQFWTFYRLAEYYFHTSDAFAKDILDSWVTWLDTHIIADNGGWKVPAWYSDYGFKHDAVNDFPDLHASVAIGMLYIYMRDENATANTWARRLLDDLRVNLQSSTWSYLYHSDYHYGWMNALVAHAFGLAVVGREGKAHTFAATQNDIDHFENMITQFFAMSGDEKPNVLNADWIPFSIVEDADNWDYAPHYIMTRQMGSMEAVILMNQPALSWAMHTGDWTWFDRLVDFMLIDTLVDLSDSSCQSLSGGFAIDQSYNHVRVMYGPYNRDHEYYHEEKNQGLIDSHGERSYHLDMRHGQAVITEDPDTAEKIAQRLLERLTAPRQYMDVTAFLEAARISLGDIVRLNNAFAGLIQTEFLCYSKEIALSQKRVRLGLMRRL